MVAPDHGSLARWRGRLEDRGIRVYTAPGRSRELLAALWRSVRSIRPDIVHLNLPHTYASQFTLGAVVARVAGARAVVTTEHLTMLAPMRLRGWLKVLLTAAVDRVITLSRSNVRDLTGSHRLSPDRIRIVANGVPDPGVIDDGRLARAREILGGGGDAPRVVHVGALTRRKGHHDLLTALGRLRDRAWHATFVGEGEEEAALRRQVADLDLGGRITFAGHQADVPALLAASDLVVLPSSREGAPLVLLEAMAVARPAVTTDIYGVPELYEGSDAGLLVPAGDPERLAGAVGALLDDPERRCRMGRAAREHYLARFTVDHMARATVAVYTEALA